MNKEAKRETGAQSIRWHFPSIHPEGRKFFVIAVVISAVIAGVTWMWMAWPLAVICFCVAAFFRDPIRTVPEGEGLIIAPADGMVSLIATVPPPLELAGEGALGDKPMIRVSIFMSVFDVHINRAPVPGRMARIVYVPGAFLSADLDKASEKNERQHFMIETKEGLNIGFTQIAGLIARRIVPLTKTEDYVERGERVGLIRFGSRVDVYLPEGTMPQVALGQRCVAGETILGRIGSKAVPLLGRRL
ncbi:MAG: phosphatidylserine decarboxylase [Zymomonas mobilis subsp. pomaceae]|uniref:Phosphatidylserine decarboxylase proenzyme n=1 Tax=Zymomonas mobilis subsp. pomaceae (strain ATCC 29192 / DSM 22645 / JCM 10191 / CCUG 17912 / NBRC 13757 / NCIMB 11200 / NRRL B-4491 / Barker I) TaxID=579138 RepID=F8ETN3_ZYMMT|nr:phosphatidylserine decarboxylase [Zymomonas mobilis]AEI37043.1 phosphatidylserine decarboxylase related protein [Zymomonas mobilis subsp. pomaceae ATCC 29192]MDX5948415.1 phosphatidylserine decarboxylase [Zymomonas mobilis subsp. pomaceae]GEB89595.1 phosphatidylserine decarboxylase proenzyme [Zymomonas mobilis subsp. pomaceae]